MPAKCSDGTFKHHKMIAEVESTKFVLKCIMCGVETRASCTKCGAGLVLNDGIDVRWTVHPLWQGEYTSMREGYGKYVLTLRAGQAQLDIIEEKSRNGHSYSYFKFHYKDERGRQCSDGSSLHRDVLQRAVQIISAMN